MISWGGNIGAEQNLSRASFWVFFGWRSIILPTIRFWGGYALGSKIEKWRMAALDVEQPCETYLGKTNFVLKFKVTRALTN